jgi:hypothetical protein
MSCQRRLTVGSRCSCSSSGNLAVSTVIVLMPRLLAASGRGSPAIAREVGCTQGTASKWRVRGQIVPVDQAAAANSSVYILCAR